MKIENIQRIIVKKDGKLYNKIDIKVNKLFDDSSVKRFV